MLSARPWKLDAIIRLLLEIFLCICGLMFIGAMAQLIAAKSDAGRSRFSPSDIVNLPSFAGKLKQSTRTDPVSTFLHTNLSATTRDLLAQYHGGANSNLQYSLAADLNALADHGAVYETNRFARVQLSAETRSLLHEHPGNTNLVRLNRLLLLDAYPDELSKAHFNEESSLAFIVGTLTLDGSILLMIFLFMHQKRIGWAQAFGFKSPGLGRALLLGLFVAIAFLPVGMLLQIVSMKLLTLVHVPTTVQQAVQSLQNSQPGWIRAYMVFVAIVIAPFAEETLFRGILYPTIKQSGYPRLALWGTSLAFAFIHLSPPIFLPLTVLALALVWLYEKTDNLLACIFAHGCFNAANVVLMYYGDAINRGLDGLWNHFN